MSWQCFICFEDMIILMVVNTRSSDKAHELSPTTDEKQKLLFIVDSHEELFCNQLCDLVLTSFPFKLPSHGELHHQVVLGM